MLNQIRSLDGERHNARAWLFMNQLNDTEAGNIGNVVPEQGNIGAIGGEPLPPPPPAGVPPVRPNPANVNIVNEYNSFNLTNVTPPIAPKWKMSETLLDDFHKFKHSCQHIFDGPMCHITSGKVKTSMLLILAGPDGEDIYENSNLLPHQKYDVDYTMYLEDLRNFVSQYATLGWPDLNSPKCTSTMVSLLTSFTIEFSKL